MAIDHTLTLGQYLRRERERRGLTIEQVASATKIGIRTLHSLESDHYSELPAKPFIRGFVISYSRFIGLDHKETLTHFNSFLDERVHQERPNREGGHSGYAFEKRDGDQSRTMLGITMGGFVVIGALAMIILKPSLKHHHGSHLDKLRGTHDSAEPGPTPSASVLATSSLSPMAPELQDSKNSKFVGPPTASPLPSPSAKPSLTPTSSPAPLAAAATPAPAMPLVLAVPVTAAPSTTPSASPSPAASSTTGDSSDPLNSGITLKPSEIVHRVVCKAVDSVWVRYRVDDRATMKFILKKGKVLVLRGRHSVILQAGEPEHLNLSGDRSGYHTMDTDPNLQTRQDDATLFFPTQLAKMTEEPFKDEKPLSGRKSPATGDSEAPSTDTP